MNELNILTNKLPDTITTSTGTFQIKTNHKEWVCFEQKLLTLEDEVEKVKLILSMVIEPTVSNQEELIELLNEVLTFYLCGDKSNKKKGSSTKRVFSFAKDQFSIYADFKRYYGIDLTSSSMHWWLFRQLLLELPEEAKTKKVMMYRSIPISSKMSKEQRSFYMKMKTIYSLNDKQTSRSVGSILAGGIKKL